MFGYVLPPMAALPSAERQRFRRAYCGLCHTLSARYGEKARWILNYDLTYLAILLSDGGEEQVREARCIASPVRKKEYLAPDGASELAADESVILAYWKLRDGAADEHGAKRATCRVSARVLESAYRKASERRPRFAEEVERQMARLAGLEQENDPSMDRAADCFAQLLAAAANEADDPTRRRVLGQILYHLGRWIYLVDAADDLKRDAAHGSYNPVALRYSLTGGVWTAESREAFAETLDYSVHMVASAFELWDFGVWTPILRETFYGSLYQVGHAVLDGTFRKRRKAKEYEEGR